MSSSHSTMNDKPPARSKTSRRRTAVETSPEVNRRRGRPKGSEPRATPPQPGREQAVRRPEPRSSNVVREGRSSRSSQQPSRQSTLYTWLISRQLTVSGADLVAIEHCVKNGWPHRTTSRPSKTHPISAVSREMCLRAALLHSLTRKNVKRMRALSWFGSTRDLAYNPKTGQPRDTSLEINWTLGPDTAVAGDATRGGSFRTNIVGTFSFVYVCDVYQSGNSANTPLTSSVVKELCALSDDSSVYLCCRLFYGFAGVDDSLEGVWVRKNNAILFSPDASEPFYCPHPDINWVGKRSYDGLSISPIGKYGPYTLVKIKPDAKKAIALNASPDPPGSVVERRHTPYCADAWPSTKALFYWNSLLYWCRGIDAPYLVHLGAYAKVSAQYQMRTSSGQILDTAYYTVFNELQKDPKMRTLRDRSGFEDVFNQIVEGTWQHSLYANRSRIAKMLHAKKELAFDDEVSLLVARNPKPAQAPSIFEWCSLERMVFLTVVFLALVVNFDGSDFFGRAVSLIFSTWELLFGTIDAVRNPILVLFDYVYPASFVHSSWMTIGRHMDYCIGIANHTQNFKTLVVYTPLLEELVGFFLPTPWFIMVLLESLLVSSSQSISTALVVLVMHSFFFLVRRMAGVHVAVVFHAIWNAGALYIDTQKRFYLASWIFWIGFVPVVFLLLALGDDRRTKGLIRFINNHASGIVSRCVDPGWSPIADWLSIAPLQSNAIIIKKQRRPLKIRVDGTGVDLPTALLLLEEHSAANKIYPILITNRLLFQPANTERNLLIAIVNRVNVDPWPSLDEPTFVEPWLEVTRKAVGMGLFISHAELPPIEDAVKPMGSRGKRLLDAHSRLDRGEALQARFTKSITLKWNETIPLKETATGDQLIPRAITNLDPGMLAITASWARRMAEMLHDIFDGSTFSWCDHTVRVLWASGAKRETFDYISELMNMGEITVVVAGDDSIVAWGPLTPIMGSPFGEMDFSKFDHTQTVGVLKDAARLWMTQMDIPSDIIDTWYWANSSKVKVKKKRLRVDFTPGTQMATGTTITTAHSSVNNILAYLFFLKNVEKQPDLVKSMNSLGFIAKYQPIHDFHDLTFLRGWWLKDMKGENIWTPLPSQILKLGKCMKPLEQIYKTSCSIGNACFALVTCYPGLEHYPIMGEFLNVLQKFAIQGDLIRDDLIERYAYKIHSTYEPMDYDFCCRYIERRYSITRAEIMDFANLCSKISYLPAYVEHQICDKLADIDY